MKTNTKQAIVLALFTINFLLIFGLAHIVGQQDEKIDKLRDDIFEKEWKKFKWEHGIGVQNQDGIIKMDDLAPPK